MPRKTGELEDPAANGLQKANSFRVVVTAPSGRTPSPAVKFPEFRSAESDHGFPVPSKKSSVYDYDDVLVMDTAHSKLAQRLFANDPEVAEQNGLLIFDDYNQDSRVLTSLGRSEASVFHTIVEHMQALVKSERNRQLIHTVTPVAKDFLECLVIKHGKLLMQPNGYGFRPLDLAALKVKPVVFLVTDLVLSEEKLKQVPESTCPAKLKARPGDICHFDLPISLRHSFAREFKDGGIPPPGACIHQTVKLRELEEWSAKLKDILASVLQPRQEEYQRGSDTILHMLLDEASFAKKGFSVETASFQRLIQLCPQATLTLRDQRGYCPLHKAIMLFEKEGIDFERLHEVIKILLQQSPNSIYLDVASYNSTEAQTPFSLLQKVDPRKKDILSQQHKEKVTYWEQTEKLLKHACIGSDRPQDDKLKYLYGGLKNARNIFLDMSFPVTIDKDFVTSISDTVRFRFETALEYVSLRHDLPSSANNPLLPPVRDASSKERNPCQGVFEWLKTEREVEKIFTVVVEDLVPYPHTDESIKTALKPFDIEVWDWRKLDICSQTIVDAAKGTKKLFLQSSGNEAVLRSWGARDGLALLNELQSITITMHPDLREAKADCLRYFNDFKRDFYIHRREKKVEIEIAWAGEQQSLAADASGTTPHPGGHQSDQVAWVQTIQPFIDFLQYNVVAEYEGDEDRPIVKIALIDNGVDSAAHMEIPVLEKGKSFYGYKDKNIPLRDYYTGPSYHGTQMASCINKVCPMVQLFVVRLDDSKSNVGKFTAESAIEAVKWATQMDVDIISMSWTFTDADSTAGERTAFETAISNASTKRILLNSLNDKDSAAPLDHFLPLRLLDVVRIGSATKWGEKAPDGKRGQSHYLFPGQEVPIPNRHGETDMVNGSSVATAFAAGLAGLIVYTARAMMHMDRRLTAGEKEKLESVVTRQGMERVFRVLAGKPNETSASDLFVELSTHFPKEPERDADKSGKEQVLRSLLTRLMLLQ